MASTFGGLAPPPSPPPNKKLATLLLINIAIMYNFHLIMHNIQAYFELYID